MLICWLHASRGCLSGAGAGAGVLVLLIQLLFEHIHSVSVSRKALLNRMLSADTATAGALLG